MSIALAIAIAVQCNYFDEFDRERTEWARLAWNGIRINYFQEESELNWPSNRPDS